jgi:eukaryotic-like serine/threonine-protein kinase
MDSGNSTDSSTHARPDDPQRAGSPHSPPLVPGSRIRDYVVERFIASGGFGNVYRVQDVAGGRPAALKLLHAELRVLGDSFVRFLREAEVLERIRHPNIIEVYGSGALGDGRAFVVMEYLSGHDLGARIEEQGALSVDAAIEILEPVCDALAHAHTHGVIHRDVKASNVFLSERDGRRRVVLLDFGLAKVIEQGGLELTASHSTLGTPSCMSPEQIRGAEVDARSDVYALGALCFHMLTGQLPFAGKTQSVMQYMHLHGQRPRPSGLANVGAVFDEVIMRAMAPDRDARHSGPEEFLAAFREAAQEQRPSRRARRAKHTQSRALAVYVDVRVSSRSHEQSDDELLDAMEAVLDVAERHLSRHGFHVGLEGSSSILFVRVLNQDESIQRDQRRKGAVAALELRRSLDSRLGQESPLHVNVCLHRDYALVKDGRVQGGDLMRLERWVPEVEVTGVVGSAEVMDGLDLHTEAVEELAQLRRLLWPPPTAAEDDPVTLSKEQSRERLMHSQMLAQLGRQVAGIVHDLRSPLTVVLGNIEEVLSKLQDGEALTDDDRLALEDALQAALQLKATTSNILGASAVKSYGGDGRQLSIPELVDNAVRLSRGETRRRAAVEVSHEGAYRIVGSPGRLTQVLVNLLVNAAQAIPEHGRITVRTCATKDGRVQISIRDTGVGMSDEVQQRIFEPFFTTKDINTGTGLGLSLVREIIEEHGGTITVDSTPGSGSCFTISLPVAPST